MGVKTLKVSSDGTTYYILPGGSGDFSIDGAVIDDTIFGQLYKSEQTGTKTAQFTGQAFYKGYPGYTATIKGITLGAPTGLTAQAMTQVGSTKTYKVSSIAHDIWDYSSTINIYDGGVNKNNQIASIDHLQGEATFLDSYSPTGAITADFSYYALSALGNPQDYSLTQQCAALQTTDLPTASSNGGWHTFTQGLKTVAATFNDIWNSSDPFGPDLTNNTVIIMEFNPDGLGEASGSLCRGYFRVLSVKKSGNVGALEIEAVSLSLVVPYGATVFTQPLNPFVWIHAASTPLSLPVQECLNAFVNNTNLYYKYLSDGNFGYGGQGVLTDVSMSGSLTAMNAFNVQINGTGAPTALTSG